MKRVACLVLIILLCVQWIGVLPWLQGRGQANRHGVSVFPLFIIKGTDQLQAFLPVAQFNTTDVNTYCIADLDNDNVTQEVIFGNYTHLWAFNSTGNLLWICSVSGIPWIGYPCIGDFDRDGYTDDFFSVSSRIAYNQTGGKAVPITTFFNGTIHYANFSACNNMVAVGDLNHDGYADDVILEHPNGSFPYFCAYSYMDPMHPLWTFSVGPPPQFFSDNLLMMQIGDLDGDGYKDDVVISTVQNCTYALNESGHILWTFPKITKGGLPVDSLICIDDFDGQGGAAEVAMIAMDAYFSMDSSLFVLNSTGGILWTTPVGTEPSYLAKGDLDHDGFEDDLVFTRENMRDLVVFDNEGILLWNHTFDESYILGAYMNRVADLDGNGFRDNIIVRVLSNDYHFHTYAFDNIGGLIGRGTMENFFYFGDFDGDGRQDDCLEGADEITLYRFDLPRITATFAPNTSHEYIASCYYSYYFHFDINSQEPFPLEVTFNLSAPKVWLPTTRLLLPGNGTATCLMVFRVAGQYNLTATLSYLGVPFCTVEWAVTVEMEVSIGMPVWFVGICALVVIGSIRFILRKKGFLFKNEIVSYNYKISLRYLFNFSS